MPLIRCSVRRRSTSDKGALGDTVTIRVSMMSFARAARRVVRRRFVVVVMGHLRVSEDARTLAVAAAGRGDAHHPAGRVTSGIARSRASRHARRTKGRCDMSKATTLVSLVTAACAAAALASLRPRDADAHCDTVDGPVVAAAKLALEKGDATPVLKWVEKDREDEVRSAFARTLAA